jgi:hypothetical protein
VTLAQAERALKRAIDAQAKLEDALARAQERAARAEESFLGDPSTRETRRTASEDVERALALADRAREATATAQRERDALARAADVASLERARRELPVAWRSELSALADRLVILDREADRVLQDVLTTADRLGAEWDEAAALAGTLDRVLDVRRPSFADGVVEIQKIATREREREQRERTDALFSPPIGFGDWRVPENASALERAQHYGDLARVEREGPAQIAAASAVRAEQEKRQQEAVKKQQESST